MIECTLRNIHTDAELKYFFEILPKVGETIMIDGIELRDNEEWQKFAGADESDPLFEGMAIRTYQVCSVHHWIHRHNQTSIEILLDEFDGKTTA